jgi:dihydroxyacetone kinase
LKELDDGLASDGSVLGVVQAVCDITETRMGGTLSAIMGIFFNALTSELIKSQSLVVAPAAACTALQSYTTARVGHRTIMDVLIPFVETLRSTSSIEDAVKAAESGAQSTRRLVPALGRATYVGREAGKELPPDPGAWGAMEIVKGLLEGYSA